jgi:hypothetical protein
MRLKVAAAVAAFAVLLPLAGLLAASSVGAAQPQTIRVIEHNINSTYVPVGGLTKCTNTASCQGDYLVWDDPLFDSTDHTRVGTFMGECFVVDSGRLLLHCPGVTITLNGRGTIDLDGRFDGSSAMLAVTSPITGGTGVFLGATGLVTGKALSAIQNSFVITITR